MAIPALKNLRKLVRTLEAPTMFENFPNELRQEQSDRAVILMCASFVDTVLKCGIWLKLPNRDAAIQLFEDQGPLHSSNAKIRMAEALGLFGPETRRNLDIIQAVRNAFAHSLVVTSFATPEVTQACNALTLPDQLTKSPIYRARRKMKFSTPRDKFIAVSILTTSAIIYSGLHLEDKEGNPCPAPP